MAAEEEGRTEAPSDKRKSEARDKGNISTSKELVSLVPLWVLFLFFTFKGQALFEGLVNYFRFSLRRSFEVSMSNLSLYEIYRTDTGIVSGMLYPLFILMPLLALAVHFYQTEFFFSLSPMKLENTVSKMNPLKGLQRLFGKNTFFELVKGLFKIAALGIVIYMILKKEVMTLPQLADMDLTGLRVVSFALISKLVLVAIAVMSLFAIADFVYQRWQYDDSLKMTKSDVKDEMRQSEGDPQVKARIKSLQRQMAMRRMMAEVPKADVIITNPTHFAVALKYEVNRMAAPTVTAKGANLIAQKIKEIAKEHKVPVFEDKPLAQTLFKLDLGHEIPEMLYKAVATILANVYKLKGKVNNI
jgi:flagellar biosynthetic protein FlhB